MTVELTATEKQRIVSWGRGLETGIMLRYTTIGHAMDASFKSFADQLAELVPGLKVKKDGDALVMRPTLFPAPHVTFQALPLNRELEPFLTLLKDSDAFAERIDGDSRERLKQLRAPAIVKIYITPHCPYCPSAVSMLLGLAACCDQVRVTVIDGDLFPDAAHKDRVRAAPTVILGDQFRWTGTVDTGALVTLMLDRDPANLGTDALRSMLEEGDAQGVAAMMIERGELFDAFVALLAHPRWSVRLGAMVAFETLAELDPQLAGEVVDPLLAVFADADVMVKGDLLHILGESGNRAALPLLNTVLADAGDADLREAAREAIEKLMTP